MSFTVPGQDVLLVQVQACLSHIFTGLNFPCEVFSVWLLKVHFLLVHQRGEVDPFPILSGASFVTHSDTD